jgi:hypothetical protein
MVDSHDTPEGSCQHILVNIRSGAVFIMTAKVEHSFLESLERMDIPSPNVSILVSERFDFATMNGWRNRVETYKELIVRILDRSSLIDQGTRIIRKRERLKSYFLAENLGKMRKRTCTLESSLRMLRGRILAADGTKMAQLAAGKGCQC